MASWASERLGNVYISVFWILAIRRPLMTSASIQCKVNWLKTEGIQKEDLKKKSES